MRKYYDDFDEDYEKGYEDGRREFLNEFELRGKDDKVVDKDKLEKILQSEKGRLKFKTESRRNGLIYIVSGYYVRLEFYIPDRRVPVIDIKLKYPSSDKLQISYSNKLNVKFSDFLINAKHWKERFSYWLEECKAIEHLLSVLKSSKDFKGYFEKD